MFGWRQYEWVRWQRKQTAKLSPSSQYETSVINNNLLSLPWHCEDGYWLFGYSNVWLKADRNLKTNFEGQLCHYACSQTLLYIHNTHTLISCILMKLCIVFSSALAPISQWISFRTFCTVVAWFITCILKFPNLFNAFQAQVLQSTQGYLLSANCYHGWYPPHLHPVIHVRRPLAP